jgi:hypothetical protein
MMEMEVHFKGNLEESLARFGDHVPKLADKVVRIVAYRYRKALKSEYLSGQYLEKRSGTLQKSLIVGRKRGEKLVYLVGSKRVHGKGVATAKLSNIYEHAGGYTIEPKDKKALVFQAADGSYVFTKRVQGKEKPFMTDSTRSFPWIATFEQATEEVIIKEMKKLEQEGVYVPGGLD